MSPLTKQDIDDLRKLYSVVPGMEGKLGAALALAEEALGTGQAPESGVGDETAFKAELFRALYDGFGFISSKACDTITDTALEVLKTHGYLSSARGEVPGEWDALTKKEMWYEIQEIRKLTDDDGTSGPPHTLVEAIINERNQLREDVDKLIVIPAPTDSAKVREAVEKLQQYRHRNGDGAIVPKGDGPWLLREDVLAALEQGGGR